MASFQPGGVAVIGMATVDYMSIWWIAFQTPAWAAAAKVSQPGNAEIPHAAQGEHWLAGEPR